MAFLTLNDIGKIYVSEGNVAVGIRGVSLSFESGEFVAVTGKSGSGKSTLLNTISGMDTYEEGELYIEGEPTSHFLQPDWEEYRQKYISFIFQEYNIIDSFTVLQNVELALMHIRDKRARRQRAMELIERVGLASHAKQKGSRLSGGQKQRTVIARALAKDSPIILADEPTGNLDAVTSAQIIKLLHEVSKNKLVIVVTHNFEDFEAYATRHIRIFDGAVAFDKELKTPEIYGKDADGENESEGVEKSENKDLADKSKKAPKAKKAKKDGREERRRERENGITLGKAIFFAKPFLSLFLCLLMLVGTAGMFLVTSMCGGMGDMFEKSYMFTHSEGRVVMSRRDGQPFSEEELEKLVKDYGAEEYLHFDGLLDMGKTASVRYNSDTNILSKLFGTMASLDNAQFCYGEDFGKNIFGRYPEKSNEVFLYLPISKQPDFGAWNFKERYISIGSQQLKAVGVKYFFDNNKPARVMFTREGFRTVNAAAYLNSGLSVDTTLLLSRKDGGGAKSIKIMVGLVPCPSLEKGQLYINDEQYFEAIEGEGADAFNKTLSFTVNTSLNGNTIVYENSYPNNAIVRNEVIADGAIADKLPEMEGYGESLGSVVLLSPELFIDYVEGALGLSYRQASLFFQNDRDADKAAEKLQAAGYVAVPSDTVFKEDKLLEVIGCMFLVVFWVLAVVFLTFFVYLCSIRSIGAFKSDMAIMRSMGISVRSIKTGVYIRMLISLLPAFVLVALGAVFIFTSPWLSGIFTFLYPWQYLLIGLGMLAITLIVTRKQIKRLFRESVKKSLRGGDR